MNEQPIDADDLGAPSQRSASDRLFRGKTPQEWRPAYAGAFDWGPDVGREAVEE